MSAGIRGVNRFIAELPDTEVQPGVYRGKKAVIALFVILFLSGVIVIDVIAENNSGLPVIS